MAQYSGNFAHHGGGGDIDKLHLRELGLEQVQSVDGDVIKLDA